jgi:hypothetical protein
MQEILERIFAVLEAQDAKIKALEAKLKAFTGGFDTVLETIYDDVDGKRFNAFSERHRAKFAPYLGIMDKLEGGDALRAVYDRSNALSGEEGYEEDAYVDKMLAGIIETIEALKSVVPPEAVPALKQAEAAVQAAAVENDKGEGLPPETIDPDEEAWSEDDLAKEQLEGHRFF